MVGASVAPVRSPYCCPKAPPWIPAPWLLSPDPRRLLLPGCTLPTLWGLWGCLYLRGTGPGVGSGWKCSPELPQCPQSQCCHSLASLEVGCGQHEGGRVSCPKSRDPLPRATLGVSESDFGGSDGESQDEGSVGWAQRRCGSDLPVFGESVRVLLLLSLCDQFREAPGGELSLDGLCHHGPGAEQRPLLGHEGSRHLEVVTSHHGCSLDSDKRPLLG